MMTMMKSRFLVLTLILAAIITACTPQTKKSQTTEAANNAVNTLAPTKKPPSSNGIVASDPTTFSLASGKLQLIEFFSFT